MSKKTKHILTAVLVLLLLALGGLVGWRLWKDKQYDKTLHTALEYRDAGRYEEARDLYLSLNLRAEADESFWKRVWSREEKINFSSTPMFVIRAGGI